MLVSVAFNFLGFVLTYLLHTTHAAKFGSRAGLGVTLIQYGWALRTRAENAEFENQFGLPDDDSAISTTPLDSSTTPAWANGTLTDMVPSPKQYPLGENAAAWLSFSLMTIGM